MPSLSRWRRPGWPTSTRRPSIRPAAIFLGVIAGTRQEGNTDRDATSVGDVARFVALVRPGGIDSPGHRDQFSGGLAVKSARGIDQENLATGGIMSDRNDLDGRRCQATDVLSFLILAAGNLFTSSSGACGRVEVLSASWAKAPGRGGQSFARVRTRHRASLHVAGLQPQREPSGGRDQSNRSVGIADQPLEGSESP